MSECKWVDGKSESCEMATLSMNWTVFSEVDGVKYCPFCGTYIEKPVVIKVGMFGFFINEEEGKGEWGTLAHIREKGFAYRYARSGKEECYLDFIPGLPEGFNQDGTPIS